MDEFSNIWIEQCDAARGIRDDWGTRKALGYLVGEKLLNYIRAADSDPSWEANVPKFAAEIRQIFTYEELKAYFATATRIGVTGHVCTEEQHETMRDAGAFDADAVTGAADAILFERARALLLSGAALDDLAVKRRRQSGIQMSGRRRRHLGKVQRWRAPPIALNP
jgi:hypothetical protein